MAWLIRVLTPALTRRKPPSGSGLGRSLDQGLWAPSLGTAGAGSRNSEGYANPSNVTLQAPSEELPESVRELFGDGGGAAAAAAASGNETSSEATQLDSTQVEYSV